MLPGLTFPFWKSCLRASWSWSYISSVWAWGPIFFTPLTASHMMWLKNRASWEKWSQGARGLQSQVCGLALGQGSCSSQIRGHRQTLAGAFSVPCGHHSSPQLQLFLTCQRSRNTLTQKIWLHWGVCLCPKARHYPRVDPAGWQSPSSSVANSCFQNEWVRLRAWISFEV